MTVDFVIRYNSSAAAGGFQPLPHQPRESAVQDPAEATRTLLLPAARIAGWS
ncbi:hypothetical protein [Streptomyces jumonjinensis]|uniref:hypothetical protein n=1 Tax=Streptomyces jumonjinensis TaxID=1945 RepID=UPI0037BB03B5